MKVAMSIAGSDPSGGAGLQADLKTFHQHGIYGTSIVTLLTVQNTMKVDAVQCLMPEFVLSQLNAVLDDIPPHAAKTGALGNATIINAVAERARRFSFPLVVDPVMISKHGDSLIDDEAVKVLRDQLIPQAFLVTPNRLEASRLAEMNVTDMVAMEQAASKIGAMGARNVLVKDGSEGVDAVDILWTEGRSYQLHGPRFETRHTHGTGCVLSAAITARLARGESILDAVKGAKQFITGAIRTSPGLGRGLGPINMHWSCSRTDHDR